MNKIICAEYDSPHFGKVVDSGKCLDCPLWSGCDYKVRPQITLTTKLVWLTMLIIALGVCGMIVYRMLEVLNAIS